jgi:hypothetical protein
MQGEKQAAEHEVAHVKMARTAKSAARSKYRYLSRSPSVPQLPHKVTSHHDARGEV